MFCEDCFKKLQFITEPKCKICSHPFEFAVKAQQTCPNCLQNPPFFDASITIYRYNEILQKTIGNFKYYDTTFLAKKFAKILATKIKGDFDFLIAVPLHKKRLKERKFNQAVLLARFLAKALKLPFYNDFLVRRKYTTKQVSLNKNEREKNLRGAFVLNEKYKDFVVGKNILLVDDVMTTGSTLNECARVLKNCGAKKITVAVLAKTVYFN